MALTNPVHGKSVFAWHERCGKELHKLTECFSCSQNSIRCQSQLQSVPISTIANMGMMSTNQLAA
eukprot:5353432-Amphidinium_carterae.1